MRTYKDDVFIDRDRLDEEWEDQPMRVIKWGRRLADAIEERDIHIKQTELLYAKIGGKIRANPSDFGLKDKPTEGAIAGKIIRDKEYREMVMEDIRLQKEVRYLEVTMRAFEHRKRALEKIQELFLTGYYAEPRAKRGSQSEQHNENERKFRHREALKNI